MLQTRLFRPLVALRACIAPIAPLSPVSPRFILPLRMRHLSSTTEQTSSNPTTPLSSSAEATELAPPATSATPNITSNRAQTPAKERYTLPGELPGEQLDKLPYSISRNKFGSYSVYMQKSKGLTKKSTIVKKIEGDIRALRRDLKTALQLEEREIAINDRTKHILIRVSI
ncbi:hypothetical protein GGR52DRAFT_208171 [Hypoxylon sp. FL1284]|nr:hypothetical protein GGR52DRAFT_208171 [Hypoxylon sp. FL1284]